MCLENRYVGEILLSKELDGNITLAIYSIFCGVDHIISQAPEGMMKISSNPLSWEKIVNKHKHA